MRRRLREFFGGVRLVGSGFGVWRSSPRLMVLGLIPGAITAALLVGVFIAIAVWVDDWAQGITSAVTNDDTPNGLLVALVAIAIVGGGVLLAIYTFTAITLLIGQPFFERISTEVAPSAGLTFTAEEESVWRATLRGVGEGARLLLFGTVVGVGTFALGLIPFIGSASAFVVSAAVGGSLLSLELTAYPLSRMGVPGLSDRRRLHKARRSLTLGFGVACYLLCLVPLGAVISMPALVAGGTLLAARVAPATASGLELPATAQP
ncbi:EI24 domain-containing protein [Demequina sp.]|uniref:EI24 domain-containing protein n=1 Tax=Demequina sp. TaxID=2050685 RepID=UPI003D0E982D